MRRGTYSLLPHLTAFEPRLPLNALLAAAHVSPFTPSVTPPSTNTPSLPSRLPLYPFRRRVVLSGERISPKLVQAPAMSVGLLSWPPSVLPSLHHSMSTHYFFSRLLRAGAVRPLEAERPERAQRAAAEALRRLAGRRPAHGFEGLGTVSVGTFRIEGEGMSFFQGAN